MARQVETHDEAVDQMWTQIARVRTCMLSVPESGQHPQPMTHFTRRDENAIWFITSADTDLAEAIGSGAPGLMTVRSDKQDYHASLRGRMSLHRDEMLIDEFWSPAATAWFEKGRDDSTIRLIRFEPTEAAIWASEGNLALVGLRLLRAGLSEDQERPALGVHHVLTLKSAA
jgi:general stress protein 26